jgi:hypothetical protein
MVARASNRAATAVFDAAGWRQGATLPKGAHACCVRAASERRVLGGRQAGVQGATEVPVYVVDEDMSPALLLKKASNLGLGGWWLGGTHMKPNKGFIGAVQQQVPKDAQLIVSCQKGLRRAPGPRRRAAPRTWPRRARRPPGCHGNVVSSAAEAAAGAL